MNLFDFVVEKNIPREQKLVLDFLIESSLVTPDKFVKVEIIQLSMPDLFGFVGDNEHNDLGRLKLRRCVNAMRNNPEIEYVIISSPLGYKIGGKKDTSRFVENYFNSALNKLKTAWAMREKLGNDGKLQFTNYGIEKVEAFRKEMGE